MTDEILGLMETRKSTKNSTNVRDLTRKIRQMCRSAKEREIQERYDQIQEIEKRNNMRQMYMEVKKLAPKSFCTKAWGLESRDGIVLLEEDKMKQRWQEYMNDL